MAERARVVLPQTLDVARLPAGGLAVACDVCQHDEFAVGEDVPMDEPPGAPQGFSQAVKGRAVRRCAAPEPRGAIADTIHVPDTSGQSCYSRARRNSWALSATMTVLADMSTAPIAGDKTIPRDASTPAASGIATML